jgi:N6-L-threonylcarbamoyladenine synthase
VIVLGIDTSCDDTSAAVVVSGRKILGNVVRSQLKMHEPHGGVVPEVASRAHLGDIDGVVREALTKSGLTLDEVDVVGVTYGPGLSGSLRVGLSFAKGLCLARDLPLIPVNHLEGHIYSSWLIADPATPAPEPSFPVLALIVSGGHTELVLMREHCRYQLLGSTRDDAAGEAFDKVGRQLGLGFPGGPAIQQAAAAYSAQLEKDGTPDSTPELPRAWLRGTSDFSFSGLKTAVWHLLEGAKREADGCLDELTRGAIALAFQESVVDVLVTKVAAAAREHKVSTVCVCGGVASNVALRTRIVESCAVHVYVPPPFLCVDNGAMIAAAAFYRQVSQVGPVAEDPYALDVVSSLALPVASSSGQ